MSGYTNGLNNNLCANFAYRTIGQKLNGREDLDDSPYWIDIGRTDWDTYGYGYPSARPSFGYYSNSNNPVPFFNLTSTAIGSECKIIKNVNLMSYPSWTIEWMQMSTSSGSPSGSDPPDIGYYRTMVMFGQSADHKGDYFIGEGKDGCYGMLYTLNGGYATGNSYSSSGISVARNVWVNLALTCYQGYCHLFINGTYSWSFPLPSGITSYVYYTSSSTGHSPTIYSTPTSYMVAEFGGSWIMAKLDFQGYMCYARVSNFARYLGNYTLAKYSWLGLEAR